MSDSFPDPHDHEWKVVDVQRLLDIHHRDTVDDWCQWRNKWLRDLACQGCDARSVDRVFARDIELDYVWTA